MDFLFSRYPLLGLLNYTASGSPGFLDIAAKLLCLCYPAVDVRSDVFADFPNLYLPGESLA